MSFTYDMEGISGNSADISLFGDLTFEEVATRMLDAAEDKAVSAVKETVRQSIKHSGASELVESVSASKRYKLYDGSGVGMTVSFKGKRSGGGTYKTTRKDSSHKSGGTRDRNVTNHDVAFWLEYGVAGRYAGKPWQDRAYRKVEEVIEPILEKEMASILGANQ